MQGSAKGFKALFMRYAQLGRKGLTEAQFHLANQQEQIWEFRKGALRIFCFEDGDGRLVMLCHGSVKKTQKVKRADIQAAVATRNRYLQAKAAGEISFEDIV